MSSRSNNCTKKASRRIAPEGYEWRAPEGGWGWVVAVGCLLITMMLALPILSFGILLKDMQRTLGISTSAASWTVSTSMAVSQVIAPVSTILIHNFSCRKTAFFGGIVLSAALIFSSFATNLPFLLFTFGILSGTGAGLARIPCMVIGSHYFPKNYIIIAGIIFSGFSIGRLIFSPLTEIILQEYGYKNTYLILGALVLHVCVGAVLFQPADRHFVLKKKEDNSKDGKEEKNDPKQKLQPATEEKSPQQSLDTQKQTDPVYINTSNSDKFTDNEKSSQNGATLQESNDGKEQQPFLKSNGQEQCHSNGESKNDTKEVAIADLEKKSPDEKSKSKEKRKAILKNLKNSLDVTLLKEPIFHIICTSCILGYLTVLYSNVFLIPLGLEKGFSPLDTSLVFSAKAGAEIAGRLGCPWVQKLVKMDTIVFFILVCLAVAASILAQAIASSFVLFLSIAVVTGIVSGGTVVVNADVMLKSVGVKRYSSTISLCAFIQGWFALFAGPLIGLVKDFTGNFVSCYVFIMGLQFLSSLLWIGRYIYIRYRKS